jgi:DNA-binding transcriptional ArsR family regulator
MDKQLPMHTAGRSIFKAIADPTRRKIIHLLSVSDLSVKELTASFAMSQPAISQHLRQLRSVRLVTLAKAGLEHRYRLTANPLREVLDWTAQYRRFFDPSGHAWSLIPSGPAAKPRSAKVRKGSPRHGN